MSTAVAPVQEAGIAGLLNSEAARKIIEPMLQPGTDYRRVIQEVYLVCKDNPALLECTKESIVRAVGRAVSWGLVIGETVHLVPFNVKVSKRGEPDRWENRCKALQDYKGKIELIVRSGSARTIDAEDVYEHDDFILELGLNPICRLRPVLDPTKRGEYIGTYAIARLSHGLSKVIWVPASEVEAIRKTHSKQWRGEGKREYWYGPKTAIHRIAKELPKSERLAKVLGAFREDDEEDELDAALDGGPVLTIGAPPTPIPGVKPVATSGTDAYADGPRSLTEGAARAVPVNHAAMQEAIRAAGGTDPYTGDLLAEVDCSDLPFPENIPATTGDLR